MSKYREILRLNSLGLSGRSIAASISCSRNTVSDVIHRAMAKGIKWPLPVDVEEKDLEKMLYPEKEITTNRRIPDMEEIHKEMRKQGVTLSLLWSEYCCNCKSNSEIPLGYTQFCYHYRKYAQTTKATMHINHKPGEQIEVDWAGKKAVIFDKITSEAISAYIFVGILSSSGYAYVEACLRQNQENWIMAHVHMFEYFEGVARIIVPDNLKTGVEKADWYSPIINKSYHEMAEHYGCAIIPARVRKPKDKAKVENTVGVITTWIMAALRNQKYFTIQELNSDIRKKLKEFNNKAFQKKEGSRTSTFLTEEKEMLMPLPVTAYELAIWKKAIVQLNYHVSVEKMLYSVPYEYIKQEVDIRITQTTIEIFFNNHRICSHPRLYGKEGEYQTITEHMPESHKEYLKWDSEMFISWADTIGNNTRVVVESILKGHKVERQGYKSCMGLLKLGDKYGVKRLEVACMKALSYTPNPSYKNINSILKSGQDKTQPPKEETRTSVEESFAFTRGAKYYGGEKDA